MTIEHQQWVLSIVKMHDDEGYEAQKMAQKLCEKPNLAADIVPHPKENQI